MFWMRQSMDEIQRISFKKITVFWTSLVVQKKKRTTKAENLSVDSAHLSDAVDFFRVVEIFSDSRRRHRRHDTPWKRSV